ncbi:DEAD-domain-containing protein [Wallemia mellicola]|nr:DEAD-domain-containing protein [Wallemia mellicola]
MGDPFSLLTKSGAFFNKKKFASDIQLFDKSLPSTSTDNQSSQLPKDLDFFGDFKTSSDKGKEKPVKKKDEVIPSYTPPTQDEINKLRKQMQINLSENAQPPLRSIDELKSCLKFENYIMRNISFLDNLTPVQAQSIPLACSDRDLLAVAPTGSGKTLAYLLPLLHSLGEPKKEGFRAVIISPTRELAQQIRNELARVGIGRRWRISVLSKANQATMKSDPSTRSKHDILISTPLRLKHAIETEEVDLSNVRHLILDEADRLLEMGFIDQVDTIVGACSHSSIRKSLFTATLPASVEEVSQNILRMPVRMIIGRKDAAAKGVQQKLMYVGREDGKLLAVRQLVQAGELKPPVLIFVQSVERANELFNELVYDGVRVDVIHGERTAAQRDEVIKQFRRGDVWVLIATDVLARGVDVQAINLVLNYDFPQSPASYVHRVGRTGRAGRIGQAITFFTNDDAPYLKSVVNVMKSSGCDVPEWMLKLKKPNSNMRKALKKRPIERETVHEAAGTNVGRDDVKKHKQIVNASKRRKLAKEDVSKEEKDRKEEKDD